MKQRVSIVFSLSLVALHYLVQHATRRSNFYDISFLEFIYISVFIFGVNWQEILIPEISCVIYLSLGVSTARIILFDRGTKFFVSSTEIPVLFTHFIFAVFIIFHPFQTLPTYFPYMPIR